MFSHSVLRLVKLSNIWHNANWIWSWTFISRAAVFRLRKKVQDDGEKMRIFWKITSFGWRPSDIRSYSYKVDLRGSFSPKPLRILSFKGNCSPSENTYFFGSRAMTFLSIMAIRLINMDNLMLIIYVGIKLTRKKELRLIYFNLRRF